MYHFKERNITKPVITKKSKCMKKIEAIIRTSRFEDVKDQI
jgi:hypothetical protein